VLVLELEVGRRLAYFHRHACVLSRHVKRECALLATHQVCHRSEGVKARTVLVEYQVNGRSAAR
jgi:hypothetical protein